MDIDINLKKYATDAQWAAYEAYCKFGSYSDAGKALLLSKGTVQQHVKRVREAALRDGYVPDGFKVAKVSTTYDEAGAAVRTSVQVKAEGADPDSVVSVPDPKKIVKTSTLYAGDGSVTAQWVMEKPDDAVKELAWVRFAEEIGRKVDRAEFIAPPALVSKDLCAVYPVGDHHVGMLAWGIETRGESYDLKRSEALLGQAAGYLMNAAPSCENAVIAFMGDFLHFDGFRPMTERSGNLLDADTRFPKVARTGIRMARHMIEAALARHAHVHIIWEIGNHDTNSAILFMELLANVYEGNRRVTVDTSPSRFHYFEFGKNLVGTTHGDTVKLPQLPLIMAMDMPDAWGRTEHRLWLTGHVHHESRKDLGVAVETVPVLIPNDAWAANAGYRSKRAMQVIVLDREDGEVERHTFNAQRFSRSI